MLDAIPDMRDALNKADESELTEMFDALRRVRHLHEVPRELAASMTPKLGKP